MGEGIVLGMLATIVWQGTEQEMSAVHPEAVPTPFEMNTKVMHPLVFVGVAITAPGPMVPEQVLISGAEVEFPSKTCKKSLPTSRSKEVKDT